MRWSWDEVHTAAPKFTWCASATIVRQTVTQTTTGPLLVYVERTNKKTLFYDGCCHSLLRVRHTIVHTAISIFLSDAAFQSYIVRKIELFVNRHFRGVLSNLGIIPIGESHMIHEPSSARAACVRSLERENHPIVRACQHQNQCHKNVKFY